MTGHMGIIPLPICELASILAMLNGCNAPFATSPEVSFSCILQGQLFSPTTVFSISVFRSWVTILGKAAVDSAHKLQRTTALFSP
jgi:hypothetical protein